MKYELGNRIRRYREQKALTQKQLAEMLGVSNSRVSNWEQGINRPDADIIANICKALNISPSDLLDVHLTDEVLTEHEKQLIFAYRERQDVRQAVDILLGINKS